MNKGLLLGCTVAVCVMTVLSQGSPNPIDPKRGASAGSSFSISDIENINLTNGNVMLNFPLVKTPAWRGGMSLTMGLTYNSKLFRPMVLEVPDFSNQLANQNLPAQSSEGGWRFVSNIGYSLVLTNRFEPGEEVPCDAGAYYYNKNAYKWKLHVLFPDGSRKEFRPHGLTDLFEDGFFNVTPNGTEYWTTYSQIGDSHTCNSGTTPPGNSNPMVYYSTDGSYIRLEVEQGSGNPFTMHFPDGSYYESSTKRQTDRYGNYVEGIEFTFDGKIAHGAQDEAGRMVFSTVGSNASEKYIYQLGVEGELIRWITRSKTIYVRGKYTTTGAGHLMERGGTSYQTGVWDLDVIYEIEMPQQLGGQKYEFEYYGSDTPPGSTEYSEGWGELKSVKLPSGAIASYEYEKDTSIQQDLITTDHILENSIKKKTLKYYAEYDGGSTLTEDVWLYGIGKTGSAVLSPDGSQMTQTHGDTSFDNTHNGLVLKIENANGTKIEKIWAFNRTPWGGTSAQINPWVKMEFTSIKDANGNYTLTAIKEFDQDKNGNSTLVKEYEYVPYGDVPRTNGFPTGLPSGSCNGKICPARSTLTTYNNAAPDSTDTSNATYAYWNFGAVKGVTAATEVKSAAGQTVAKNEITYDNYSTTANPTLTRTWDSAKGSISTPLTDGNSVKTQSTYNSYGMPLTTTDANGTVTQITYGNVAGPNGNVTSLYPTQTIAAYGTNLARTSTAIYDFYTGLVTSATDEDNDVTNATEYDDLGRPLKAITAEGTALESWTQTIYDDVNRRVIVKSDLETIGDAKKVAIQHFDQLGRVRLARTLENAATEDPTNEQHGIKVQTRYAVAYSSPNGYTYQLNSNPYRAATSSAASSEATMGWSRSKSWHTGIKQEVETFSGAGLPAPWGSNSTSTGKVVTDIDANTATVTDQTGKLRRSITNGLGQLIRVDEPNSSNQLGAVGSPNQETSYAYDTLNNLITVTQGSQTRSFTYSSLSRLLTAANPESGTIAYVYDNNGNLTKKTDARNVETNYTYDALNRVTERAYGTPSPSPSPAQYQTTPTVTYTYGTTAPKVGILTKVESSVSTTEYTSFDILGRVTGHKQTTDGVDYTTGYSYNLSGAMIEETYPSGRVVKNVLDTNGDLAMVQSSKNSNYGLHTYANSFSYNAAGAVTSMQLGNGRWESATFNSRLQPTQIALGTTPGATDKLDLDFTYGSTENNGNVLTQTINFSGLAHPFIQTYTYDSLNRLDDSNETYNGTQTWRQDFSYDRYGNRNFVEANTSFAGFDKLCNGNTELCSTLRKQLNPGINSGNNNRINSGQDYTYDAAGNTLTDANTQTYVYDGESKQVKASNGGGTLGEYFYDGDGRRVKKVVPGTGEVTVFVYDATGKQIAEYSTVVASANDAKVAYLTADHLGSPRINTDQNGAVTARHDYHPFGDEIATAQRTVGLNYLGDTVRKQFTGYEREGETDLDFAQARYYSRSLGRFTATDPLAASASPGDPQSFNRYAYVLNSPCTLTDSTGMAVDDCPPECPTLDVSVNGSDRAEIARVTVSLSGLPEELISTSGSTQIMTSITLRGVRAPDLDIANAPPLKSVEGIALAFEAMSAVPILSVPASIGAGVVRFGQGDFTGAGTNMAMMIPFAKLAKLGTAVNVAGDAAVTGGRLGSATTRSQIDDIASILERRGYTITGGGQRNLAEEYLKPLTGGRRGGAYVDITAEHPRFGMLRINTVDTLKNGVTPTARELRNAGRIRNQLGPRNHLLLIPKR